MIARMGALSRSSVGDEEGRGEVGCASVRGRAPRRRAHSSKPPPPRLTQASAIHWAGHQGAQGARGRAWWASKRATHRASQSARGSCPRATTRESTLRRRALPAHAGTPNRPRLPRYRASRGLPRLKYCSPMSNRFATVRTRSAASWEAGRGAKRAIASQRGRRATGLDCRLGRWYYTNRRVNIIQINFEVKKRRWAAMNTAPVETSALANSWRSECGEADDKRQPTTNLLHQPPIIPSHMTSLPLSCPDKPTQDP